MTAHHPTWLRTLAAVTNRARRGRSNPRHANRTHRYATKPADPAKRPKPRGALTLVMLPMTLRPAVLS